MPTRRWPRAGDWRAQLAGQSPTAARLIKRALNDGVDGDLVRGLAVEREAVIEALASPDAIEGFTAFLEKRPPNFDTAYYRDCPGARRPSTITQEMTPGPPRVWARPRRAPAT